MTTVIFEFLWFGDYQQRPSLDFTHARSSEPNVATSVNERT